MPGILTFDSRCSAYAPVIHEIVLCGALYPLEHLLICCDMPGILTLIQGVRRMLHRSCGRFGRRVDCELDVHMSLGQLIVPRCSHRNARSDAIIDGDHLRSF